MQKSESMLFLWHQKGTFGVLMSLQPWTSVLV